MPVPEKKNPLGPTGVRVQTNVARLRDMRGLTYKDLADRLASIGRGIPVLGLSRIERGERRVDADDLVALAIALGTTPARLLLPDVGGEDDEVALTPAVARPAEAAWAWVRGDEPIAMAPDVPGYMYPDNTTFGELVDDFRRHSLPAFERQRLQERHTSMRAATDVLDRIKGFVHLGRREEQRKSLRRALNRLIAEIDDLIGDDEDGR